MFNTLDLNAFFTQVLKNMNINPSEGAIDFLKTWARYERRKQGTPHGFNPLNTTMDMKKVDPKQTNHNVNAGYPVKNYSSFEIGAKATSKTLQLPYYKNIAQALKEGLNAQLAFNRSGLAKELSTWGSKTFAKNFIDAARIPRPTNKKKPTPPAPKKDNNLVTTIIVVFAIAGLIYLTLNYQNLLI